MTDVSRRDFLVTGLVGLSSVALVPLGVRGARAGNDGPGRAYVSLQTGRVLRGVPTTCGLCPAGCGLLAYCDEGRLVGVAGNPEHPHNRGALCAFGSAVLLLQDDSLRIGAPLRRRRTRGAGDWEAVSWQEAMGTLSRALAGSGAGGPVALAAPVRSLSPFLRGFAGALEQGLLVEADAYERPVEEAAHALLGWTEGGAADLENARLVLNFGANLLGSPRRLVGAGRAWSACREAGGQWITVDPRLSETAAASAEWVPVRPGTDGVLALALARLILENRWEARAFLGDGTDLDPERLGQRLGPWTAERASRACGVPADRIRDIAERFGSADRAVALFGSGVTAREGGVEDARAVLLLNLLAGNLGRPGGYLRRRPVAWRDPSAGGGVAAEPVPGTLFRDLLAGRRRIGALITCEADPAAWDPLCHRTREALGDEQRVPLHICLASAWNETARMADLVLPAATCLESWSLREPDSASSGPAWIGLQQPVCAARGPGRPLEEILLVAGRGSGGRLARELPHERMETYYRDLIRRTLGDAAGGAPFRRLRERGFLEWTPDAKTTATPLRVAVLLEGVERAIAGRAERDARSAGTAGDPVLLLHRSPTRVETAPPSPWTEEIDHASPVRVHPTLAGRIGVADGDRVLLEGPGGTIRTRVHLTEGIHPSAAAMAGTGDGGSAPGRAWWAGEVYGENARRLVPWPEPDGPAAPGWVGTRVSLRRISGEEDA